MSKVIITGINGFVGEHVARTFRDQGYEVVGVGYQVEPETKVTALLDSYVQCDLMSEEEVGEKLAFGDVDAVIHLAGMANVGESFEKPHMYLVYNGVMAYNILSKAQSDEIKGRVVVISTGALYDPNQPLPLTEESNTNPNSPYAIGKLMTEDVTTYFKSRGLDTVIARPFNHIGPGQGLGFLLPDLYNSLIEAGADGEVKVGNLKTKRDYTDVRDIAKAYLRLAESDSLSHGVYNICSGQTLSGEEILLQLQRLMKLGNVKVKVDQSRVRPNDIMEIKGSYERILTDTDWQPSISIERTVSDFVASKK